MCGDGYYLLFDRRNYGGEDMTDRELIKKQSEMITLLFNEKRTLEKKVADLEQQIADMQCVNVVINRGPTRFVPIGGKR